MTAQPAIQTISIDDYLRGEEHSEIKHEYLDGLVYAMTGTTMPGASLECEAFLEEWNPGMDYTATRRHNLLTASFMALLHSHARARGCQLFASDMKLRLDHRDETYFYYPDLLLTCTDDDRHPLYCTQPRLLIEVVSPSSERIDLHRRTAQGWTHSTHNEDTIHLECIECDLALNDIYADQPEILAA